MTASPFEIRIPRQAARLGVIRAFFHALVRESDDIALTEAEIAEVQLVLQEACINSIRHAGPAGGDQYVRLTFETHPDRLQIEIQDNGAGFDPDAVPDPQVDELQEGGYGVYIMKQSMDRVEARRDRDGFVLTLTKHYRVASPDPT